MARWYTDDEVKGLEPKLVAMLDNACDIIHVKIPITSGYRSPDHNTTVGGVSDSAHTTGLAVDVRAPDEVFGKMVAFAFGRVGFERVGFYDKHIHGDIDTSKPTPAIWQGISH